MSDRLQALLETARRVRAEDAVASRAAYAEAADLARADMRPDVLAHALRHLSDLDREARRNDAARMEADEAVALYRQSGGGLDLANALRLAALARGGSETRLLWAEARDIYQAAGVDAGVAECERQLASPSQ